MALIDTVETIVGQHLGIPADDARVTTAAAAALELADRYCYGGADDGADPPVALTLPDEPLAAQAVAALAVRVHTSTGAPGGVLADDYATTYLPEDPHRSVRHLLDAYRTQWGIG